MAAPVKFILTSFHPPFIPILRALAAEHVIVTMHPHFTKMLADLDIPAKNLAEWSTPDLSTVAFNQAGRILGRAKAPKNGLEPAALEFVRGNLPAFLYPRLADVVSFVLALDTLNPALVLVHNDVEALTRAAALWARAHDKPALHVPHAVYLDIEKGQPGDDIHDLVSATHLAVAGWFQRQWYAARGAGQIYETGLPQFDKIATLPHDPQQARQRLGLDSARPVVTYASSWRQDTNLLGCHDGVNESYLAMLEVMKRLPGVQFVVKLHPRANNGQWHVDTAKQAGVHCLVTAQYLENVLQASDAVLTYSGSNLLLEASFFPWVRLLATQGYDGDTEVTRVNTDPPDVDKITATLAAVLGNQPANVQAFQAKYLGKPDGKAAERITTLVRELIGG